MCVLQADGEGWAPTPQKLASVTASGATSAAPAVPHRAPQAALTDGMPKAGTKTRSLNELVNHLSRDEQEASRRALSRTPSPLPGQHSPCLVPDLFFLCTSVGFSSPVQCQASSCHA